MNTDKKVNSVWGTALSVDCIGYSSIGGLYCMGYIMCALLVGCMSYCSIGGLYGV